MTDSNSISNSIIRIPNNWTPYKHQLDSLKAFDNGLKKQCLIWHRRAGKDNVALNLIAREAISNPGVYWVVYPTQTHAKSAVWTNIDSDGIRMIDHVFPPEIIKRKNDHEMIIELTNGSIVRLMAADSDKLVGANPIGIVFSEWALCDPTAWDYVRPILRRNKGWVVFITTFRGKNHAYTQYQILKDNPEWFVSLQTIKDTGLLTEKDMDDERREGMSEAMIQQEYYCSPMAALEGAYYTEEMLEMERSNRITDIAYDSTLPVYCSFDLGHSGQGDLTVCAYIQDPFNTPRIIHSQAWRQTSIPEIVEDIKQHPWGTNSILLLPHDGGHGEIGTGKTRLQMFKDQHTWVRAEVVPRIRNIQDSIEQLRQMLKVCLINNRDRDNFAMVEALQGFRAKVVPGAVGSISTYSDKPLHSWESDWVASLRTYASWRSGAGNQIRKPKPKPNWSQLSSVFNY